MDEARTTMESTCQVHRWLSPDSNRTWSISLEDLWPELAAGRCVVQREYSDERYAYLVLRQSGGSGLTERERILCEGFLAGKSQKMLAIESGLALSTVSSILKRVRQALGIPIAPGTIHVSITVLYHVWRRTFALPEHVLDASADVVVVRLPRPEAWATTALSKARREILGYLLEGRSHAEMAKLRHSRPRTIANQVGEVYRAYGVSGRQDLLRRILEHHQRTNGHLQLH